MNAQRIVIVYLDEAGVYPKAVGAGILVDGSLDAAPSVTLTETSSKMLSDALDRLIDQQTREYASTEAYALALAVGT